MGLLKPFEANRRGSPMIIPASGSKKLLRLEVKAGEHNRRKNSARCPSHSGSVEVEGPQAGEAVLRAPLTGRVVDVKRKHGKSETPMDFEWFYIDLGSLVVWPHDIDKMINCIMDVLRFKGIHSSPITSGRVSVAQSSYRTQLRPTFCSCARALVGLWNLACNNQMTVISQPD